MEYRGLRIWEGWHYEWRALCVPIVGIAAHRGSKRYWTTKHPSVSPIEAYLCVNTPAPTHIMNGNNLCASLTWQLRRPRCKLPVHPPPPLLHRTVYIKRTVTNLQMLVAILRHFFRMDQTRVAKETSKGNNAQKYGQIDRGKGIGDR
jgi:hypothetical protein